VTNKLKEWNMSGSTNENVAVNNEATHFRLLFVGLYCSSKDFIDLQINNQLFLRREIVVIAEL